MSSDKVKNSIEVAKSKSITSVNMTSMLCNSALLNLKLPGFIWVYILSFITSKEEALYRSNEKKAKEYEKHDIAAYYKSKLEEDIRSDPPTYYFQPHMNKLTSRDIIDTHFKYHQYALSCAPYFIYNKTCGCESYIGKIKRKSTRVFRTIIEELLPLLLDIFIDGDFEDKHPSHKYVVRIRNGLAIKNTIMDPTTPYITKLDAIRSLIAIFNCSILRLFKIPDLNQTYTHFYINGNNMVIPIPMTLDVYLGLASHKLQKL
jgi:hypothetical protein